ncbi:MAG TPA: AAA family ATPase [Streptosporangiaceae bacterium]|nr:AAA family ATPase [Streptosporangiaceae bacterium]
MKKDDVVSTGQLIALEGPKGCGKTTLIAALSKRLDKDAQQMRVILTKEPTPHFDLSNEQRLRGLALAQAITEDRSRHVAEVISPALAAGHTVVCDRYILSSFVFQTLDGVSESVIWGLNSSFPPPTLNLILRVTTEELRQRRYRRPTATRLQAASVTEEAEACRRRLKNDPLWARES